MKNPIPEVFNYFTSLKINQDTEDYDRKTPFWLLSRTYNVSNEFKKRAFTEMIKNKVRVDMPDIKGRTPFLNLYEKRDYDTAYSLLDKRANVN